ncbi:MAG TPA: nickel pincer cofactor biosynthesis protein LarB [bacterium]|nr:nickel pincer cofactor biosynthesis protein LarB [bacterium]
MNEDALSRLLDDVRAGRVSVGDALTALRWMPFADLGFAKADTHRPLRRGAPEAVYCPGKSIAQIVEIAAALRRAGGPVLLTRATPDVAAGVAESFPDAEYAAHARLVVLGGVPRRRTGCVGILTGGTGDLPVAEEAAWTAEVMGAEVARAYDVGVSGLHRLGAHRGLLERARALVVAAGMDGALPAVVAGLTRAPVIGVPTSVGYGVHLGGIAPLFTMLNACAPGVAVVNIDNGFGAGYLAACINGAAAGGGGERDGTEVRSTETRGADAEGPHATRLP